MFPSSPWGFLVFQPLLWQCPVTLGSSCHFDRRPSIWYKHLKLPRKEQLTSSFLPNAGLTAFFFWEQHHWKLWWSTLASSLFWKVPPLPGSGTRPFPVEDGGVWGRGPASPPALRQCGPCPTRHPAALPGRCPPEQPSSTVLSSDNRTVCSSPRGRLQGHACLCRAPASPGTRSPD